MPTKTDRELLAAWRETGDESAFAELVARHRQMVYRTSLRMLGNVHDTEDAVQAVFVVLAQKADRLQREGSLGGWLHTVTRHVAMQALARRASHARREKELAMWSEADIETSAPDVDTSAVLRCLDQELAGLSAVLRQAVVLRYLQGNIEKAAAELAGCPLGTLSRRASQGLAKLRARLAKRGVALSGVALAGLLTSEASAAVPETLLPSILATVKSVAATGAATTALASVALGAKEAATTTTAMLAKGAMKAMFIAKVKMVALVTAAAIAVGGAGVTAVVAVEGRKLIEVVAASRRLKPAWSRDGSVAVLHEGVPDAEVDVLRKDLASPDAAVRRDAAWRAGWMRDARVVPLLVKAAKDADTRTARKAVEGLRRLEWKAVAALDETAIDLLAVELDLTAEKDAPNRRTAVSALAYASGEGLQTARPTQTGDEQALNRRC
jgi:RNA polymerase sigma factor (sigma-70 family)